MATEATAPSPSGSAVTEGVADNSAAVTKVPEVSEGGHDLWCTSATLAMITGYLCGDQGVTMCEAASDTFPPHHCCPPPDKTPDDCSKTTWPHFRKHGYSSTIRPDYPSWKTLVGEIAGARPVAITENHHDGAHMMVVTGYALSASLQLIEVYDPGNQTNLWYVDDDLRKSNGERWPGRTYYAISPADSADCQNDGGDGCRDNPGPSAPKPCSAVGVKSAGRSLAAAAAPVKSADGLVVAESSVAFIKALAPVDPESLGFANGTNIPNARLDMACDDLDTVGANVITAGAPLPPDPDPTGAQKTEKFCDYTVNGAGPGGIVIIDRDQGSDYRAVQFGAPAVAQGFAAALKEIQRLNPQAPLPPRVKVKRILYVSVLHLYIVETTDGRLLSTRKIGTVEQATPYERSKFLINLKDAVQAGLKPGFPPL